MKKIRKLRKIWLVLLVLIFILAFAVIGSVSFYKYNLQAVGNSSVPKEVVIAKGTNSKKIAKLLKEKNIIKNESVFIIYLKLHQVNNLNFGTYLFQENMDVEEITKLLQKGSSYNPNAVKVTFQEGINMREVAKIIASSTNNTYDEVIAKANDSEYIKKLQKKYWFITSEINKSGIYYKLEGYLFPDTYELTGKDVSVEYIFNKMIDKMAKELEPYKDFDYSMLSIHERLSLASMVEKESPIKSDRSKMASVFLNRKNKGMNLGSDVTARYANKVDNKNQALTKKQFDFVNPYNTRASDGSMNGKLPIGPIACVSSSSIEAAFAPDNHSYLYFISNIKTQETFFYEKYSDFLNKKEELKEVNQGF